MTDRSFFDKVHNRKNSLSVKYNTGPAKADSDVIPMWIADMDFRSPAEVTEALERTAGLGIYGYEGVGDEYDALIKNWYKKRMGWKITAEHVLRTPGVMFSVAATIRALSEPGDGVMIFQPVYYPFVSVIKDNGRKLVISELIVREGRYEIDFDDMESKIKAEKVRVLLFCSPHNPVGRVWGRSELKTVADICLRHGVLIISDEIHSDFVLEGCHIPLETVSDEAGAVTVTCVSPTKTFNLAGLKVSSIIAEDPGLYASIEKELRSMAFWEINMMAAAASNSAYTYGENWLDELLEYLKGNISVLESYFPDGAPISHVHQEGTYLSWLDCRALNTDTPAGLILKRAGVWLHEGSVFGLGGQGYVRMNIACPRSVLREACYRIQNAVMSV